MNKKPSVTRTNKNTVRIDLSKMGKAEQEVLGSQAYRGVREAFEDPEFARGFEEWLASGGMERHNEGVRRAREAQCAT